VYAPMVHSNWHPQGFLKLLGVLDFAGGNVVHVASGVSGLAVVLVIGRRRGYGKRTFKPSSIPMTCAGMAMMWVAWYGLTAGCAFGANFNTGYAMLATQIAASTGALSWWLVEWAVTRESTVLGFISGAVAGLVGITPGSGCVDMNGAFLIGLFAGPLCYGGSMLKRFFDFDDALDAFGVHAVGGIVGGIATGFFATDQVVMGPQPGLLQGTSVQGVYYAGFHHGGNQLAAQLCGVLFAIGWPFCWSFVIAWVLENTIGLRVSREVEKAGLDLEIHGETIDRKRRHVHDGGSEGGERDEGEGEEGEEGVEGEGGGDGGEEMHLV
jgi:Amt family ammonium transporter